MPLDTHFVSEYAMRFKHVHGFYKTELNAYHQGRQCQLLKQEVKVSEQMKQTKYGKRYGVL